MAGAKTILIHAARTEILDDFHQLATAWGFEVAFTRGQDDLERHLEKGDYDILLLAPRQEARQLLRLPSGKGQQLLKLAEIEKQHILRVLASTGGNKTRAARILDVDTKTLYNKLKLYEQGIVGRRRRGLEAAEAAGS